MRGVHFFVGTAAVEADLVCNPPREAKRVKRVSNIFGKKSKSEIENSIQLLSSFVIRGKEYTKDDDNGWRYLWSEE